MPVLRRQDIPLRLLAPLKGSAVPRTWLLFDTETHEDRQGEVSYHHFHVGWACLWRRATDKQKERTVWTWFLSAAGLNGYIQETALRYKRIHVAAHNIFFDMQASGTFTFLSGQGWKMDFYYDRGLTYILKCSLGDASITFLSTTNWFDQSLKSLGKLIGLEKKDIDFEKHTADDLKAYCLRDVEIILAALRYFIHFIQDNDLGSLALTKASQAFTAYRHRFLPERVFLHDLGDVHALERAAYMGGRTECFYIGEAKGGPFVSLDVNSMYPFVMKRHKYPTQLLHVATAPTLKWIREVITSYGVVAEVELSTPQPVYAVRHKNKTVFPVGCFTTALCTEGLRYALDHGHVRRINTAAIYLMRDLFTSYVNEIHKIRRSYHAEDNTVMETFSKYMLNALYGKFAQLEIVNEKEFITDPNEYSREVIFNPVTGHNVIVTRMMHMEITQRTGGEGKNSSVAIAAHITENARLVLWEIINQLGYDRVLYCDTDSVKIRKKDMKYVTWPMGPTRLGSLKVEAESKQLVIEGAKNYRTEHGRRIKGIPSAAKELAPGVFSYRWFAGQITHLKKGIPAGTRVQEVTRTLSATYDKGIIHPSGKVTPLRF